MVIKDSEESYTTNLGQQRCFEKVAKGEARKLSTVQEIITRNTDYLRRIIAPLEDKESHNVLLVPAL